MSKLKSSDEVQAVVDCTQFIVLSVAPFRVMPPPLAEVSVGDSVSPSVIFISSTEIELLFIVVVVPLIVRFPPTVTSPVV